MTGTFSCNIDAASDLMHGTDGFFYADMCNIFYSVASPVGSHTHEANPDKKVIRQQIRQSLASRMDWFDLHLQRAGATNRKNEIIAGGLRGVFEIMRDRYKNGTYRGSGHHAQQEAAACAAIHIHKALNGR